MHECVYINRNIFFSVNKFEVNDNSSVYIRSYQEHVSIQLYESQITNMVSINSYLSCHLKCGSFWYWAEWELYIKILHIKLASNPREVIRPNYVHHIKSNDRNWNVTSATASLPSTFCIPIASYSYKVSHYICIEAAQLQTIPQLFCTAFNFIKYFLPNWRAYA